MIVACDKQEQTHVDALQVQPVSSTATGVDNPSLLQPHSLTCKAGAPQSWPSSSKQGLGI